MLVGFTITSCKKDECPSPTMPEGYFPVKWAGYWELSYDDSTVYLHEYSTAELNQNDVWDMFFEEMGGGGDSAFTSYSDAKLGIVDELYVKESSPNIKSVCYISYGIMNTANYSNWRYIE